jgi:peptide/nickel transport system ATP-binding protein
VPILRVNNLKTAYKTRLGEYIRAVDGVSMRLEEGMQVGIAGESGCGKSTLALSMMGFFFPPLTYISGEVIYEGRNIMELPYETLRHEILGKIIAYVPQAAMNALSPTLRVSQFIYDIMRAHDRNVTKKQVVDLLHERFALLGLPERAINAYPNELSGGMKQRVVIAASTILNPHILIADEPTSALDVTSQKQVIQMMQRMLKMGIVKSIVYITHELPLLRQITTHIMVMYAGVIVEQGTQEEMIFDPIHPYTRALMGSIIVPEEGIRSRRIAGIPGVPPHLGKEIIGCRFKDRCAYAGTLCTRCEGVERDIGNGRRYRCDLEESALRVVYSNE